MKLIIAGPRDLIVEPLFIQQKLVQFGIYDQITEVVTGKATGIDTCGEKWVEHEFLADLEYQHRCDINHKIREIKIKEFPVTKEDWKRLGKNAGPIRNKKMAEYGDVLLLIWRGNSPGSANMKKNMILLNKPIYEVII